MPNSTLHHEAMQEAQMEILNWFTSDLRIRLAVSTTQKAFNLASIKASLNRTLLAYEKSALLGPATDNQETRAFLFRESFEQLAREIVATVDSGLTNQELAALKVSRGASPKVTPDTASEPSEA